ncbi:MAG: glycosyltransferase [candidate division Zixibacteria bacterium]|nr:glycosyltransferase [candidate division Zixibacteria bacterium]
MKYDTSLRQWIARRMEMIERADIVVGIPCYNNQDTIGHVVKMVSHGLYDHFKDYRSVIVISDGGSTDDTREIARDTNVRPWQEKLVSIYRGVAGKGSALRSIFEIAEHLDAKATMVVDSDLRSITGEWVKHLLDPVLNHQYDFVSPVYTRYKYDGTITNNVVYNITRALYGKRIRQPIGGDFAFSVKAARHYMEQDVWDTDIARFGIDIWMTTSAVVQSMSVCQAHLGTKIHDAKDPAAHLAPMFRQVVHTLFSLMENNEPFWRNVKGSQPTEIFGGNGDSEPEPVSVNLAALCRGFRHGYDQFGIFWEQIFSPESFEAIKSAYETPDEEFNLDISSWVSILYELAATFHKWEAHRYKLLEFATPLYNGRVASFINSTIDMDSRQAEAVVEEQAKAFEDRRGYLDELWTAAGGMTEDLNRKLGQS